MRAKQFMLVLLVALATLAVDVAAAAAGPGPRRPMPPQTTRATTPLPASVIVPTTAAILPGASYPWVQPGWVRQSGASIPVLPRSIHVGTTQLPGWIQIA